MVGDHGHQEAARAVVPTKLVLGPEPRLRCSLCCFCDVSSCVCVLYAIDARCPSVCFCASPLCAFVLPRRRAQIDQVTRDTAPRLQ